jgi:hypothetical protein
MLTLVCSLIAHLGALTALAIMRLGPAGAGATKLAARAAGALLLAALVTGILCLLLTPVIWRLRTVKPPLAIVVAAVVVGLAPLVTWVVLGWFNP